MEKRIKVSVIVPVFNAEEYILETAEYIKNQTLQEIEIIYVDDGSTDQTEEKLKQIASKDDRVTLLKQQNKYAGVARNKGLEKATGEYVVFWDGDDIFHTDALEKMYEKCVKEKADICICGANHFDEETGKLQETTTYLKPSRTPEVTPFGHQEIDKYLFNFSTNVPWNKMYRRAFVEENKLRFQELPQANDNYFVMKAYFYAEVFTVVDEKLIDYRINYKASLTGNASKTPSCVYEAYKKTYDELKTEERFQDVKQSFYNKTLRGFLYFLSKQTDMDAYETIYNILKKDIVNDWEFPKEQEYYYSAKDYDRLLRIREMDAKQYLLSEFTKYFKENTSLKDRNSKQKEKIEKNKEKIEKQKEKIDSLKEKSAKQKERIEYLKEKIEEIKHSSAYKIGRFITFIPRKIKDIMKGKKR